MVGLISGLDINSELDELDREEFYRLKKVSTSPEMCWETTLTLYRWPTKSNATTRLQMPR